MAKGTLKVFDAAPSYIKNRVVDVSAGTWKCALISNPITSLLVSEVNPNLGSTNITEVAAGGNYVAGGKTLTLLNVSANAVFTMALSTAEQSSGKLVWTAVAGNPSNVRTAVIYDSISTNPSDAAICFIDLTEDGGSTAIDLTSRDIELTFGLGSNLRGQILRIKTSN